MSLPAMKTETPAPKKEKKRYVRKHENLFNILSKLKLWPSRTGTLHGIRSISRNGGYIEFTTHCGHQVRIKDSKTSRVSRWLRNKWYTRGCPQCKVPDWKLQKFSATSFK